MNTKPRVVALLETMWGDRFGTVPRAFRINPRNFSGRRLYRMVGEATDLWVTNACPELQTHATHHGKPDPAWVAENLRRLEPIAVLLVCGTVAAKTYDASGYEPEGLVMRLKHPAARTWTNREIDEVARKIANVLRRKP